MTFALRLAAASKSRVEAVDLLYEGWRRVFAVRRPAARPAAPRHPHGPAAHDVLEGLRGDRADAARPGAGASGPLFDGKCAMT